jgi:hypothetical protein
MGSFFVDVTSVMVPPSTISMDDLVASYLSQRGYSNPVDTQAPTAASIVPAPLREFARHVGLSMDACAANHVLFHGMNKGDPAAYEHSYTRLLQWIGNSLDMYKLELHALAFPLFVHCYLELVSKDHTETAKTFFQRHAKDHQRLHRLEMRQLGCVLTREHLTLNEFAKQVLHSKFQVQLSLLTFQLLHTFLSDHQMFLLLYILNERVSISVASSHPSLLLPEIETTSDVSTTTTSLVPQRPPMLVEEHDSPLFQTSGTMNAVLSNILHHWISIKIGTFFAVLCFSVSQTRTNDSFHIMGSLAAYAVLSLHVHSILYIYIYIY